MICFETLPVHPICSTVLCSNNESCISPLMIKHTLVYFACGLDVSRTGALDLLLQLLTYYYV